jgi:hypothetical protein
MNQEKKYRLAQGTQVRQEDFGLLFYTMSGPRLYFLPVKQWITTDFFEGHFSLPCWFEKNNIPIKNAGKLYEKIETCLNQLNEKGVILEC